MTTVYEQDVKCAHCGVTSSHMVIGSTNAMGYPDLDLRPPEMQRSTMRVWAQQCPGCGLVAADLAQEQGDIGDLLLSERYCSVRTNGSLPQLTSRFWCAAMVDDDRGDHRAGFHSMLCAAWAADDAHLEELAQQCRRLAIESFNRDPDEVWDSRFQLLDVLRRASLWSEAEALVNDLQQPTPSPQLSKVVEFQSKLVAERDHRSYTFGDALA